jgi:hypothetical protein
MRDANYISERLSGLKQELSDIRLETALYWSVIRILSWRKQVAP